MSQIEDKSLVHESCSFMCGYIKYGTWLAGRHLPVDGCLIMMCMNGCAEISVNSRTYLMSSGMLSFVTFDMVVIPVSLSLDFEAIYFSMDFVATQDIFFLVTSNRFWDFIYTSPVFSVADYIADAMRRWLYLLGWMQSMCPGKLREKTMRNEAENFMLIMASRVESSLGALGVSPSKNRAWTIVNDFIALINRYYASHHDVAFYADRLNVTPNYLNIITKKNTGISAKEQINKQIGLVAKALLDTTDLSVKQIAGRLHFDDPSYLCRVFRKQTGMSPIQYRNKFRSEKDCI